MSELERVTDSYADRAVPREQGVGPLGLALVVIAIFISLPAYIQGIELGHALGFYDALIAFVAGSAVLMAIGCCCAAVGARTRLSTYLIIGRTFGIKGAKVVNLVFSITIFGWFGVVIAEFSRAVMASLDMFQMAPFADMTGLNLIGSLLMVATAVFGFRGLNLLSNLVTPMLVLAMGMIIYLSLSSLGPGALSAPVVNRLTMGDAISSVVGAMIVSMVIFPDYARYCRSVPQALLGVVLSLSVLPVFFATAALSGIATGESQLVPVIVQLGLGIWGLIVIVFAAWTTNTSNLYVTTLSLSTLITGLKSWQITLIAGLLGFLVATAGISDHLIPFLLILGTLLPPVGSIYVLHYLCFGEQAYADQQAGSERAICPAAFAAWVIGGAAGFFGTSAGGGWSVSGVPTLDSIFVSGALYYLFKRVEAGIVLRFAARREG